MPHFSLLCALWPCVKLGDTVIFCSLIHSCNYETLTGNWTLSLSRTLNNDFSVLQIRAFEFREVWAHVQAHTAVAGRDSSPTVSGPKACALIWTQACPLRSLLNDLFSSEEGRSHSVCAHRDPAGCPGILKKSYNTHNIVKYMLTSSWLKKE